MKPAPRDVVLALAPEFILTRTALVITGRPAFGQWMDAGGKLKQFHQSVMGWIGDWLCYGEHHYGEKYAQAVETTGYEIQTLNGAQWVANRIENVRRRISLPWAYHKEVAALEPEEQDRLLDQAEQGDWTRHRLREAVRAFHRALNAPELLPEGPFDVIYADPPWPYDNQIASLGADLSALRNDASGRDPGSRDHTPGGRRCIYHHYLRPDAAKPWKDFTDWRERQLRSAARVNHLLGVSPSQDPAVTAGLDGQYGLGPERTLKQFEQFSGVFFKDQLITERARLGDFDASL